MYATKHSAPDSSSQVTTRRLFLKALAGTVATSAILAASRAADAGRPQRETGSAPLILTLQGFADSESAPKRYERRSPE